MKLLWVSIAGIVVVLATLLLLGGDEARKRVRSAEASSPDAGFADASAAAPVASASPANQASSAASAPSSRTDLEGQLDAIRARAEQRGEVLDDDFAEGRRLIKAGADGLDADRVRLLTRDFTRDLDLLRRDLPLRPTTDELKRLAEKIAKTRDDDARRKLVARYRASMDELPENYRLPYRQRLKTALAK